MSGWIRLTERVEGGAIGVTERTARRWIRFGIGGEFPPSEAVRLIGGRWWVLPRLFEEWLWKVGTGCRNGRSILEVDRSAHVRAVWHKWRGRFPQG